MKAKKRLGQHFLNQDTIAEEIANSLIMQPGVKHILEVGPGKGILTKFLLKREESLHLVEVDPDMIEILTNRYKSLEVHRANFLKLDLAQLVPEPFHLIGNFPYNISSQIVFKVLDYRSIIPQMVGMFQKEVALRISSPHGSKSYGILSVLVQVFYDVEHLFSLGPSAFSPPPKVDSAVVRFVRKDNPLLDPIHEGKLRQLVKLAFNQRRKMLRNSLKSLMPKADKSTVWSLRPEQLSVADFVDLTLNLVSLSAQ